jgi:hypothetical protein
MAVVAVSMQERVHVGMHGQTLKLHLPGAAVVATARRARLGFIPEFVLRYWILN